jgi:hypothetical protein
MAKNLFKAKCRAGTHTFVQFPHRLLSHPRFNALSAIAKEALLFLASQYKGHNNGDLTIAFKVAKAAGIQSNGSLRRGTLELIEVGFAIQTRQGGRNRCSLFALAWFPIDDCDGKLDVPATRVAPIDWGKIGTLSELNRVQCELNRVQSEEISATESVH